MRGPWTASPWLGPALVGALALGGCDTPSTDVVFDNQFPVASGMVVYAAFWQSARVSAPVLPGRASPLQKALPATDNTAYVVLAPGWDPSGSAAPMSFTVLQSRAGYSLAFNDTLTIPVNDTTFAGNCATGSTLTQSQADFLTQRVFASIFANFTYDAATCTATPTGHPSTDAGAVE